MNFGMIASGGIGSRMGCKIPKQFLKLGEKPILAYSIEKFLNVCEIDFLCVSTPKIWFFETESLVNKYFKKFKDKIHVVCGGETRNETILNMINYAEKNLSNQSELDFAVTHDAARPFVTEKMIRKSLEIAKTGKVCTFGEKINDTVVETKDNKMVEKFLNREKIVKIQTPQTFDMREFKRLYG